MTSDRFCLVASGRFWSLLVASSHQVLHVPPDAPLRRIARRCLDSLRERRYYTGMPSQVRPPSTNVHDRARPCTTVHDRARPHTTARPSVTFQTFHDLP